MQNFAQYGVVELTNADQELVAGGSLISDFTGALLQGVGAVAGAVVVVARALGDELGLAYIHN